MNYQIITDDKGNAVAIKCLQCGMTSYHPEDVRHHYCGNCHVFHDDLERHVRFGIPYAIDSEMSLSPELLKALGVPDDFLTGDTSYSTTGIALGTPEHGTN